MKRAMMLLLAVGLVSPALAHGDRLYFMFFVKGKGDRKKFTNEQVMEMQKQHIANFSAPTNLGKVLAAGPLGENIDRRGIVILNVPNLHHVRPRFQGDPFVQNGLLDIEVWRWKIEGGKVNDQYSRTEMDQYTLAILSRGPEWKSTGDAWTQHRGYLSNAMESGFMGIHGPVQDRFGAVKVMIFKDKDKAKVQKFLDQDPLVKGKMVTTTVYGLYMAKNILKP